MCEPLANNRRLHYAHGCVAQLKANLVRAELAIVLTYSAGSRAADNAYSRKHGFHGLRGLARDYAHRHDVLLLIDARGASCASQLLPHLKDWLASGRAACIDGPNLAAREAATVLRFCAEFYDALPRTMLFTQDDPQLKSLRALGVGNASWVQAMEAAYAARAALADGVLADEDAGRQKPWELQPCPCFVDHESTFAPESYGVYRPMHWWLRTFMARYTSARHSLSRLVAWPRHAQFTVPRAAVRLRSLRFWRLNANLTAAPSPLKQHFPRRPDETQVAYKRHAKWANFGPFAVDLGPLPPRGRASPDNRRAADGMALALMYERLWFRIFDPLLAEATPPFAECYDESALRLGPVRCSGIACPVAPSRAVREGGCAATDRARLTQAEPDWSFGPSRPEGNCLAPGCQIDFASKLALGSTLWSERGAV